MRIVTCFCLFMFCWTTIVGSEVVYTKRQNNDIREGAGSFYNFVVIVPKNTLLTVVEKSGKWMKVKLPDQQVGWIAVNCLSKKKDNKKLTQQPGKKWSSSKASRTGVAAAIKGFARKFGKTDPGNVDLVLEYSQKGFSSLELANFQRAIDQYPSSNRGKFDIDGLGLDIPDYDPVLQEKQIGTGIATRLVSRGIVKDDKLQRYINLICATITEHSKIYDWDFTLFILEDNSINGFACPGGYIFITLGALQQCSDESELAGMIAHEVAHVIRRHGLQEMTKRIVQIASDEAFDELEEESEKKSEVEEELETLMEESYEMIVHKRLLSYEVEADKIASVLCADAGYDPFGIVKISEKVAGLQTERPDMFDPEFISKTDSAERYKVMKGFVEKRYTSSKPGARMKERFDREVSVAK